MNDTNDMKNTEQESSEQTEAKKHELALQNYRGSLKSVNDSYLFIVILSVAVIALGLVCAVVSKVFIGLLIAILGVLFYTAMTSNVLYRRLGISYRSTSGALTVTQLYGQKREEIWIPERLLWINVTEIGDKAFNHASSGDIKAVHLPSTLKVIGENIFEGCPALRTVYFDGSEEEWGRIESATDFSAYVIVFASQEETAQINNQPDVTEGEEE